MSGKYIIGVDGGSQSSKVVIFDLKGDAICVANRPLRPLSRPRPGIAEHPDDDLWDSIAAACRDVMTAFSGEPRDIVGVGLCTIRCCRAFLRRDGSLARPVMSWMDSRAYEPFQFDDTQVAYATTSSGYLTHRFTGRMTDSAANSIAEQWPIDPDTWSWSDDPGPFERWNVPRHMLFDLQMPGSILGHVTAEAFAATGIPEGTPVIATANDKAVEALGAGALEEDSALVSLGTYIAGMVHGRQNVTTARDFWTNFASIPGRYLYESRGIRKGMWTVSWFTDLLGEGVAEAAASLGLTPVQYLEREAEHVPAGSDGLLTIPDWLAPSSEPYRKGVMIGFDSRHTRGHMFRSILEAIALTMKNRVDEMCEELGITLGSIVVSGGGSASTLFMGIFADVFGIPASRSVGGGGASLGSAICAAVGTGAYPDFETAVARMTKPRQAFSPDPESAAAYRRINETVYRSLPLAVGEILKRSYPIFNQ